MSIWEGPQGTCTYCGAAFYYADQVLGNGDYAKFWAPKDRCAMCGGRYHEMVRKDVHVVRQKPEEVPMCLDNIEEIAAAVEAAKKAKADSEEFDRRVAGTECKSTAVVIEHMQFGVDELRLIHARRIEAAESRLRDLGFRGPVNKSPAADPGDAQRTLSSNRTGEAR